MSRVHGVDLLPGENVELTSKPHLLSFVRYHLVAVYLMSVSVFLGWLYYYLQAHRSLLSVLDLVFGVIPGVRTEEVVVLVLFWALLLLGGYVVGILWVTKMPLLYMVTVAAVGTFSEFYFSTPVFIPRVMVKLILMGAAALLGVVMTEAYRRGHIYILTDYRIIMKKKFISREEREITYDKITDIHVRQGILGRIFNYGTIVPISASGFGMGEDLALASTFAAANVKKAAVGFGVEGGKSVQRPRAATYFSLYGIANLRKARTIISRRRLESQEAPILMRIENLLKEARDNS